MERFISGPEIYARFIGSNLYIGVPALSTSRVRGEGVPTELSFAGTNIAHFADFSDFPRVCVINSGECCFKSCLICVWGFVFEWKGWIRVCVRFYGESLVKLF